MTKESLLWICGAVAVIVIIILAMRGCDRRDDREEISYRDSLAVSRERIKYLEKMEASAARRFNELKERHAHDSAHWASQSIIRSKEVARQRARINELQEAARPAIESIPEVAALNDAKDSLIQFQAAEIDTLQRALNIEQMTARDLIRSHESSEVIRDGIERELRAQLEIATGRVDKLERRGRRQGIKTTVAVVATAVIVWVISR